MAISRSTGLVDFIATDGNVRQSLSNCKVLIFGGTMPTGTAAADTGSSGVNPLVTITKASGNYTAETRAQWKFTITDSTAADIISSVKVAGVELLPSTLTCVGVNDTDAASLGALIDSNRSFHGFDASVTANAITLTAPVGSGTAYNSVSVTTTTSGVTVTYNDGGGTGAVFITGVAAANGLGWTYTPASGVITKDSNTWSGTIATTGTATWFMIVTGSDTGLASSNTARRVIGTVGTSGADLNLSSTALTATGTLTISSWTLTVTQ